METIQAQKESFTVTFEGGQADNHEIDVQLLAESLVSMKNTFEKISVSKYGRGTEVYMKVKGQMKATSFGVDLVMGCIANAVAITPNVDFLLSSFVNLIQLVKWAKGDSVTKGQTVKDSPGSVMVSNRDGEQMVVARDVINYYNNINIRCEMKGVTGPLTQSSIETIKISSDSLPAETVIQKKDAASFGFEQDGDDRESVAEVRLEIRTANFDGRAAGWRFYDGENDFPAQVEDADFLAKVASKETIISSGDELLVVQRTVQSRPNKKLTITRTILEVKEVIPFVPSENSEA